MLYKILIVTIFTLSCITNGESSFQLVNDDNLNSSDFIIISRDRRHHKSNGNGNGYGHSNGNSDWYNNNFHHWLKHLFNIQHSHEGDTNEYDYNGTYTPVSSPTASPSLQPSISPSFDPTASPSSDPTASPSSEPTASPSLQPSISPSFEPTASPSSDPTALPSLQPSISPSFEPTTSPSLIPTDSLISTLGRSTSENSMNGTYMYSGIGGIILIAIIVIVMVLRKKKSRDRVVQNPNYGNVSFSNNISEEIVGDKNEYEEPVVNNNYVYNNDEHLYDALSLENIQNFENKYDEAIDTCEHNDLYDEAVDFNKDLDSNDEAGDNSNTNFV